MIKRIITPLLEKKIGTNKAIIVIGPRQVGKTTLIWHLLDKRDVLFLDGDDPITRRLLTNANTEQLKSLIKEKPFVFIDEAQRVDNIGLTLKIVTDQIKTTQLFVSGSSSFELSNLTREPLTGRKWEYTFTTLVVFGGAFFAAFPLFYSTSFGGAYWAWMIMLFSFVVQAVSYEFQSKPGNIFGPKTYRAMLFLDGI